MMYESPEAATLEVNELSIFVNSKEDSQPKSQMNKFMLDKVLPVAAHIVSLLIGLGIMIIISHFVE